MPTIEELEQVIFSMSPHYAAGPDGMNGKKFQSYWKLICHDLLKETHSFFCGHLMPK